MAFSKEITVLAPKEYQYIGSSLHSPTDVKNAVTWGLMCFKELSAYHCMCVAQFKYYASGLDCFRYLCTFKVVLKTFQDHCSFILHGYGVLHWNYCAIKAIQDHYIGIILCTVLPRPSFLWTTYHYQRMFHNIEGIDTPSTDLYHTAAV